MAKIYRGRCRRERDDFLVVLSTGLCWWVVSYGHSTPISECDDWWTGEDLSRLDLVAEIPEEEAVAYAKRGGPWTGRVEEARKLWLRGHVEEGAADRRLQEEIAEHQITLAAYEASRVKCADLEDVIASLRAEITRQTERGDRWCEAHSRLSERIEAALP